MYSRARWGWGATLAVATLAFCGISASWAVELGGTAWSLAGSRTLTVTKVKAQREKFDTGHGVLTFAGVPADLGGSCTLDIFDNANVLESSYPCTWTTIAGKQTFTVTLDQATIQSELQALAESGFNQPVVVTITLDTGKGKVAKRSGRMSVLLHVKGTMQVSGEVRARNFNVIMRGTGTQTP